MLLDKTIYDDFGPYYVRLLEGAVFWFMIIPYQQNQLSILKAHMAILVLGEKV